MKASPIKGANRLAILKALGDGPASLTQILNRIHVMEGWLPSRSSCEKLIRVMFREGDVLVQEGCPNKWRLPE